MVDQSSALYHLTKPTSTVLHIFQCVSTKTVVLIAPTFITFSPTSAVVACSSVAATTTVFFANVATSSTGAIHVQPSQLPYTSSFAKTTAVTSTVPSDVVIGNTSMPHSYQILYIGK